MIRVGCCGFAASHAAYYRRFPVVEIQQTFYQPPRLSTAERWRNEAPRDFEFTMKAWQLITHEPTSPTYRRLTRPIPASTRTRYGSFRPTDEVLSAWNETRAFARALGAQVIVFQCPARFTPTSEHIRNLQRFFKRIARGSIICCWEPRGAWEPGVIESLCRELELIHSVDPFVAQPVTRGLCYFRLHGRGGYRYRYTDADLTQLVRWGRQAGPTYVLFNNVAMLEDATRYLGAIR